MTELFIISPPSSSSCVTELSILSLSLTRKTKDFIFSEMWITWEPSFFKKKNTVKAYSSSWKVSTSLLLSNTKKSNQWASVNQALQAATVLPRLVKNNFGDAKVISLATVVDFNDTFIQIQCVLNSAIAHRTARCWQELVTMFTLICHRWISDRGIEDANS